MPPAAVNLFLAWTCSGRINTVWLRCSVLILALERWSWVVCLFSCLCACLLAAGVHACVLVCPAARNNLSVVGAAKLTNALTRRGNVIHTLDLAGNRVGNPGFAAICGILSERHCRLLSLDASANYLREEAAHSLHLALRFVPRRCVWS